MIQLRLLMKSDCTILTVCYNDALLFKENIQLMRALNPDTLIDFLVVDNSQKESERALLEKDAYIIEGCGKPTIAGDGSNHHAHALAKGLTQVATRYLIIIDPDFFVVQRNWINYCIQQMEEKDLGVIGSVWNPRWTLHPRYVPSVHFLCIDLNKLPKQEIVFTPSLHKQHIISFINTLFPSNSLVRRIFQGRLRGTAWRLPRAIKKYSLSVGLLTPVYNPFLYETARNIKIDKWILERFSLTPKINHYYKKKGFLQKTNTLDKEWEEFYLNNKPFAFHMRRTSTKHTRRTDAIQEEIIVLYRHLRELLQ